MKSRMSAPTMDITNPAGCSAVCQIGFQITATAIDEVKPDVRSAVVGRARRRRSPSPHRAPGAAGRHVFPSEGVR